MDIQSELEVRSEGPHWLVGYLQTVLRQVVQQDAESGTIRPRLRILPKIAQHLSCHTVLCHETRQKCRTTPRLPARRPGSRPVDIVMVVGCRGQVECCLQARTTSRAGKLRSRPSCETPNIASCKAVKRRFTNKEPEKGAQQTFRISTAFGRSGAESWPGSSGGIVSKVVGRVPPGSSDPGC